MDDVLQDLDSSAESSTADEAILSTYTHHPDLLDETSKDSGVDLQEPWSSPLSSPASTALPVSFRGLFTSSLYPDNQPHGAVASLRRTLFSSDEADETLDAPAATNSPVVMQGHHASRRHRVCSSRKLIIRSHNLSAQLQQAPDIQDDKRNTCSSPVALMGHGASRRHTANARRHTLKRKIQVDSPSAKRVRLNTTSNQSEKAKAAIEKQATSPGQLIGDGSASFRLHTVAGPRQQHKYITPDTLADLLTGHTSLGQAADYQLIDCRYPYEYQGGHVPGAVNLYSQEKLEDFMNSSHQSSEKRRDSVLIFYCEFSSERAPKRAEFFRELDRKLNADVYPKLNFPEIYIVLGGYKAFYEAQAVLCTPQGYTPMLHNAHRSDMKKFRSKSKSWTAGEIIH